MRLVKVAHKTHSKISASFADPSASAVKTSEQRRSTRYSNDFRISLLDAKSRPADEAVRLLDMSSSGVGIESSRELPVGRPLGFRMTLGKGAPIRAKARVRWARPLGYHYNYGLEFEGLGYFSRRRLGRFLEPESFGIVEAFTLALEAGTSIIVVLIAADIVRSNPYLAQTLFVCMPFLLLLSLAALVSWLLKSA